MWAQLGPNRSMRSILRLLGIEASTRDSDPAAPDMGGPDTETVARITAALSRLPQPRARYLAAFAYVLARVAHADLDISDDELREIHRIVREVGALAEDEAALVVEIARSHVIERSGTEDYVVTRQLRRMSTRDQRIDVVRCLYAVAAADGSISQLESRSVSMIGAELGLTADEIAALRSERREQLAVLRPGPNESPPGAGTGGSGE